MAEESPFPPPPRVRGILEHYSRAVWFTRCASEANTDPVIKFRLYMAAVYSARAIVEIMMESAEAEELKIKRNELKPQLVSLLPWFSMIERIRIHDFHRYGCNAPDPKRITMTMDGPIKLKGCKGAASLSVSPDGKIEANETGKMEADLQRPLTQSGDRFGDEHTPYTPIEQILREYLNEIPKAIELHNSQLLPNA